MKISLTGRLSAVLLAVTAFFWSLAVMLFPGWLIFIMLRDIMSWRE